jgi:hypothetical protein
MDDSAIDYRSLDSPADGDAAAPLTNEGIIQAYGHDSTDYADAFIARQRGEYPGDDDDSSASAGEADDSSASAGEADDSSASAGDGEDATAYQPSEELSLRPAYRSLDPRPGRGGTSG